MVAVLRPGGPIAQLSSLFFFLSALVSDVLLIRLCLVVANACLLTTALLGFPLWPAVEWTGQLGVDTLVWSSLSLAFHALSLYLLLWDERRVRFASADEEQLWRFFYRRSGMGRLEMKESLKFGRWLRVPAGAAITRGQGARLAFHVLVQGTATIRCLYRGVPEEPRMQYSGCCFDMGTLNVFGIFIGFEKFNDLHTFSAAADTDCLLYCWTIEELAAMATQLAPAVGVYWRNFALAQLGHYMWGKMHPAQELLCATGEPEPDAIFKGARSRDFTDALRSYEKEDPTLGGLLRWIWRSLNPFPPPGLRHTALPITGIMARNRAVALKAAQCKAALQRQQEARGKSEDEATAAVAGASGRVAYDILSALQDMRRIQLISLEELLDDVSVRSGHSVASAPLPNADTGSGGGGGGPPSPSVLLAVPFGRSLSLPAGPVTATLSDVA